MDEEWEVVSSFLPEGWRELARETGALKGLRKDKSVDALLRTLLLHLACGHSLRETVVRARKANLADLSDVALLKRLRKSGDWLHALCVALFREQGMAMVGRWRVPGQGLRRDDGEGAGPDRGAVAPALQRAPSVAGVRLLQAHGERGTGHGRGVLAVPGRRGRLCARRPGVLDCCGPSTTWCLRGVMSPCA